MTIAPGTQVGAFRVLSGIGVGGMGEVYRAHDTRLNRDVALKIIHPPLVDDEYVARFRREAHALAALNHPHVAAIYELDEIDGRVFLVMELVPGGTLHDRIARGAPPVAEGLRICGQVAEALEAAHDTGIVHRDLKPANIKLTNGGEVKVLDFGIATMSRNAGGDPDAATVHLGVTAPGTIMGTVAYMSPEQTRGQMVDKRTDIWAFGCVLYEVLTGRPAFEGQTASDVLARVLERDPDWSALPETLPPGIRRLLRRCLKKDAQQRLRDIGDARLEIGEALSASAADGEATRAHGNSRPRLAWIVGAIAVAVVVGALVATRLQTSQPHTPGAAAHFLVNLPVTARLAGLDFPAVAVSPDGSLLAYIATRGGQQQLFVRPMDRLDATPLEGTSNATGPFFSPDGRWIAFFADGQLKKVSTAGGLPVTLCEAPVGLGGSWGSTIVFAAATGSGLSQVSPDGGKPQRVTSLDAKSSEFSHRWPEWLPDGKTVIYTVGTVGSWDDAQIVAQSLTTGQRSVLVRGGTNPHYLSSGHLVYTHGAAILAVPFDPSALKVTGTPVRVLDNVLQSSDGAGQLSVSRSGTAVYIAGALESDQRRLVAVDRSGTVTPFAAPARQYRTPRLSPDGGKLLVTIEGARENVWLYDITSGSLTELTADARATDPIWTPDGRRATFSSNKAGPLNLFWTQVLDQTPAERLAPSENVQIPGAWSPGGDTLAFVERRPSTGRDIWLIGLQGDRRPRPFLDSPFDESAPRFSPDGRWLAYVSNVSGRNEVYVRSVGESGRNQKVSDTGGTEPVWARDGRQLFYRDGGTMMAASFGPTGIDSRTMQPQRLFDGGFAKGTIDSANYDITPDSQRFVMVQAERAAGGPAALHVLLNWVGAMQFSETPR